MWLILFVFVSTLPLAFGEQCRLCGFKVVPDLPDDEHQCSVAARNPKSPEHYSTTPRFMPVLMVYREMPDNKFATTNCAQECMNKQSCEAYVKRMDGCFQVTPKFSLGKPAKGDTFLKVTKCAVIPPLGRVLRFYGQPLHYWNQKPGPPVGSYEEPYWVFYCYAREKRDCNLVPFGRSKDGKTLSVHKFDIRIGWASPTYGECGATQPIEKWYRKDIGDTMFVVQNHNEPNIHGDGYKNGGVQFYLWPDDHGTNCADP